MAVILALGISVNLWYFTEFSGGSVSEPVLNNLDSSRFFICAKEIYMGEPISVNVPYLGYPFIVAMLWKLTGVTIVVPLLINYFFTLLSVVLTSFIAIRIISGRVSATELNRLGAVAMLLVGVCSFYLGCGTVVLKEPSIYLGSALAIYIISGLAERKAQSRERQNREILLFVFAVVLLAFNRLMILPLFILGTLIFASKTNLRQVAIMCILASVIMCLGTVFSLREMSEHMSVYASDNLAVSNYIPDRQHDYNRIVEGYFEFPQWKKILFLPITATVQYFIPFAWTALQDVEYGPTQVYSHFGFGWYFVGGLILFYLFFSKYFKYDSTILKWIIFATISYIVPAFLFAGSVSRYWLPYLPLYVVFGANVILGLKNADCRRAFKWWAIFYLLLVVIILIIGYRLMLND
ncbi:MAG: hypothetical protein PHR45_03885 [Muribaculaceae bacterium]|nr:hypothetical protein [Muribaculaceae bacterium]